MIVVLDARKLRDGGIGTYIRGLLHAFAREPRNDRFVALMGPEDLGRERWAGDAVAERPVRAGKYGVLEHVVVPRAARRAGGALLHAPHYTLPLGWSGVSVVTIHDLIHVRFAHFYPPGASTYARAMATLAVRRARRVIVNSEHTRRDVMELLGAPEERVRTIGLGIPETLSRPDPDKIEAFRAARGLPADYVLYVGARKRHKNLELLLDAWASISESERPPLVISGPPWTRKERLAARALARGVTRWVSFGGPVDDEGTLACLYGGAALYVQPSLAEGFGLPPLEAMACGTPVLSSDAGSLPEVLGDAAILRPPRDPEGWAHDILALLGDAGRREDLVARGRARAATFTWARAADRTRAVYAEAVA